MTLDEAIIIVTARSGVERYRYLCLEHPDAKIREAYARWVINQASLDPTLPPIPDYSADDAAKPFVGKPCGGCP